MSRKRCHRDIWEQMAEMGQCPNGLAFRMRHIAKFLYAAVWVADPAVSPEKFDDVDIVVLPRIKRLSVSRADVIAFKQSFDENLPVCIELLLSGREQMPLGTEKVRHDVGRCEAWRVL